jgi:predicted transcriptional regulator of viral defense system
MPRQSTIQILKQLPILFRKTEVEKWTKHAPVFLSRAVQKGLTHRLSRGYYINTFLKGWPSVEEVGCFFRPPAYVSSEWALHKHGLLLQVPQTCTIITLQSAVGQSRSLDYQGTTLEFSRIAPKLFFGFKREYHYDLADPEKAILDLLYLRGKIPFADELELGGVDFEKLLDFSKKFPKTVQKKISLLKQAVQE